MCTIRMLRKGEDKFINFYTPPIENIEIEVRTLWTFTNMHIYIYNIYLYSALFFFTSWHSKNSNGTLWPWDFRDNVLCGSNFSISSIVQILAAFRGKVPVASFKTFLKNTCMTWQLRAHFFLNLVVLVALR